MRQPCSQRRSGHGKTLRRDGREPLGLGTAIGMMMTERGLVAPAAGGSVLPQWDTILTAAAPELAGHVRAVAVDEESGRLDVVPDAPRTPRRPAGARRSSSRSPTRRYPARAYGRSTSWRPLPAPPPQRRPGLPPMPRRRGRSFRPGR